MSTPCPMHQGYERLSPKRRLCLFQAMRQELDEARVALTEFESRHRNASCGPRPKPSTKETE